MLQEFGHHKGEETPEQRAARLAVAAQHPVERAFAEARRAALKAFVERMKSIASGDSAAAGTGSGSSSRYTHCAPPSFHAPYWLCLSSDTLGGLSRSESWGIREVDLAWNSVGGRSAEALFVGLQHNQKLEV